MRIPKQIKLGRTRYRVELRNAMPGRFGMIRYGEQRIEIARRNSRTGRLISERAMAQTFWHEVTHGILRDMGHRLEANEEFVEAFSQRLNAAIHSASF